MMHRIATLGLTAALTTAVLAAPAPASAGDDYGDRSLAEVLAADGDSFDDTWRDFDVLDRAVRVVLSENPESPVGVLADGSVALTAFLPTDGAFRKLVGDITGKKPANERKVWKKVKKTFDVDTVEQVLLYHVVPGEPITSAMAAEADGVTLTMAQGGEVTVNVKDSGIFLQDANKDVKNPRLLTSLLDINEGNHQVGHGMNRVLLPG